MADFVGALVEMGFAKDNAEKAVTATKGQSVEAAMEWILANGTNDEMGKDTETKGAAEATVTDTVVRSYKCVDCGKQLKNEEEMEYHAAKTGHSNFSESNEEKKPLTEEEKAEQLKKIEEKLKIKKAEREEREKQEAIEKEKLRMKSGKDVGEAKRRFEEQEMKEIVEARRREKLEDKKARERVRAQIEADKESRRQKAAAELAAKDPSAAAAASSSTTPVSIESPQPSSTESSPPVKKVYTTTKLQIRLPNGKALFQSFGVNEPLAAVRLYVEINRDDGVTTPFKLMTSYPRKIFEGEDYEIPLEALGLVPSGVLMVTKSV